MTFYQFLRLLGPPDGHLVVPVSIEKSKLLFCLQCLCSQIYFRVNGTRKYSANSYKNYYSLRNISEKPSGIGKFLSVIKANNKFKHDKTELYMNGVKMVGTYAAFLI